MTTWLILIVALLLVAGAVGYLQVTRRRREHLRARFGPEYDRAVAERGSARAADRDLAARESDHARLTLRPLSEDVRQNYLATWTAVQTAFVDSPEAAVRDADRLVTNVLTDRGYPTDDPDRISRELSVEHAEVLSDFRAAHDISDRANRREATTEELRRAMRHYRTIFETVLSGG